jgi:hypothetical protein
MGSRLNPRLHPHLPDGRSTGKAIGDWNSDPEHWPCQAQNRFASGRLKFGFRNNAIEGLGAGPHLPYHDRGCPTFRGFRNVGTTDLDKFGNYSRCLQYPGFRLVWASATI